MKPESVKQNGRYQLSASVARYLRVPVQAVTVVSRDSVQTFRCRMANGSYESIAADDFNPIPALCSVLDAGPL